MSNRHRTAFRNGLPYWYTELVSLNEITDDVGMSFGILRVPPDASQTETDEECETQLVVLGGAGTIRVGHKPVTAVKRSSLFTQRPWAFTFPRGVRWNVSTRSDQELELAVIKAVNKRDFAPVLLRPDEVSAEQRGRGLASGTMHREVRAIFGDPRAPVRPPESNLVVGEVVNFPGRWSSYPPHYHPHAEVYYYRFDKPQGFGVSVLNEEAYVVREHDVVKILNCTGHAQTAAPGYAMWYLWFIRQIDGNRYDGDPPFTYFPEHAWVLDPQARVWTPSEA